MSRRTNASAGKKTTSAKIWTEPSITSSYVPLVFLYRARTKHRFSRGVRTSLSILSTENSQANFLHNKIDRSVRFALSIGESQYEHRLSGDGKPTKLSELERMTTTTESETGQKGRGGWAQKFGPNRPSRLATCLWYFYTAPGRNIVSPAVSALHYRF